MVHSTQKKTQTIKTIKKKNNDNKDRQKSTINVQIFTYKLKRQWFHSVEVNLTTLIAGFVSVAITLLAGSDNLHIQLDMRFLSTAEQVDTPTLTNIWLALLHRGT